MVNEQLAAYIRQQLAAGNSKEDIRKMALAAGWQPTVLDESFAAAQPQPTPVAAVTAKPIQPQAVTPPATVTPVTYKPVSATNPLPVTAAVAPAKEVPVVAAAPSRKRFWILTLAIIALVLLIGGGVAAYAYVAQIGPFSVTQYSEDSFISDLLTKSAQIKTGTYKVSFGLSVDPREKDAVPFVVPADNEALNTQYANDAKRSADIASLVSTLKYNYGERTSYNYKTGKTTVTQATRPFPAQLSAADTKSSFGGATLSTTDPVTKQPYAYAVTEGGKNFSLTATFETPAAISSIKRNYDYSATTTIVDGQKVTFTKDSGYIYLPSKAPTPLFVMLADALKSISPDINGIVSVGATTDFSAASSTQWHFDAAAGGSFGDLTYQIDVEALKKDADYYVRVNKIPALLGAFSNYKGQWIEISPSAASSTGAYSSYYNEFSSLASHISASEVDYKKARADATEEFRSLAALADKDKLISFKTKSVRETVDGKTLYRYDLTVRKEAIIPFYKDALASAEKYKELDVSQDQGLLDYLQSKEFDDVFAYFNNNVFLTFWTDTDGFPAMFEYRMRIVPPDTATQLKDKQISIDVKTTLTNINKPVTIEAPKDAKPVETVIDEINNNTDNPLTQARMKGSDAAVQSDLATTQVQAEIYYGNNNNSYGTQKWASGAASMCTTGMFKDTNITNALTSAESANGDGKNILCYAYGTGYVAGAELKTAGWWCVDSTGNAKTETGALPTKAIKACP